MLLGCHKKSYLIHDKITNFRIFTQPIPNFFKVQNSKLRKPKQGRDSCFKINEYYIIFQKFVISSHIKKLFLWYASNIRSIIKFRFNNICSDINHKGDLIWDHVRDCFSKRNFVFTYRLQNWNIVSDWVTFD